MAGKEPPAQPAASSWRSWGSWLSDTVNDVVDKSSQVVQDLASAVDEAEEKPTTPAPLKLYRTEAEVEVDKQTQKEIDVDQKILLSTTGVIADTTSYLTSIISDGLNKIQSTDMDGIMTQAGAVGLNTKEFGQQFVTQTVGALGTVGDRAKDILGLPDDQMEEGELMEEQEKPKEAKKAKIASFASHFDNGIGNVHLQALELLSTECTMKVQETQRKADPAALGRLVTFLQMITDKYEDDDEEEESKAPLPLVCSKVLPILFTHLYKSDKVESIKNDLSKLKDSVNDKLKALEEEFQGNLLLARQNTAESADKKPEEEILEAQKVEVEEKEEKGEISANENEEKPEEEEEEEKEEKEEELPLLLEIESLQEFLAKLRALELVLMAEMSAKSVELVNRVTENWLVVGQQKDEKEGGGETVQYPVQVLANVSFISSRCNELADDISAVSMKFVSASKQANATSVASEEVEKKYAELTKATTSKIYGDAGDAIAKVHEAKEFTIPVLQRIYILAETTLAM